MKIGIVGLGSIGKRHAINATNLGHDVYTYDPLIGGDSRFKYEKDLYDWCDAAIICTPSSMHTGGLRACVERGKHCLVEKPISIGTGSLEELLRVAADKKLTVMMGNNLRFHPAVQRAKLWMTERKGGKPIWANFICATPFSKTAIRDGVLLNTGAHEVDVALHLFGPAHAVCGNVTALDADIMADFLLQHETGTRSSFHIDLITDNRIRQFIIAGTNDNCRVDLDTRCFLAQTVAGGSEFFGGSYDDDYVAEMRAFVDRIEGHLVPGATGEDGLECLKVLLDVRKKAGLP